MQAFIGTGVALVTPFTQEGAVDVVSLEKIVEYNIKGNVDYLVVLGTTAETATLSEAEKKLVIETIVRVNAHRLPLVIGIGGNNTADVIEQMKADYVTHFQAILSVSPYYNKPSQEGIYQHFKAISDHAPLPVIMYNVPGRTASNVSAATTIRIAENCKNIIGIKEAAGDLVQAMEIIRKKPKDFLVISGDDIIALPMTLAGGAGVISVIGEGFPEAFSRMIRLGLERQVDKAYEIHYALTEVIQMIFEQGNPAGIKEVFQNLKLSENKVRLPLVEVDAALAQRIADFTKQFSQSYKI